MDNQQILKEIIRKKDVKFLVKHKWGFDLTPGQEEIVRKIAFREHNKLSVSAMTRYGKSQCVTWGLALLIDFGVKVKIAFLGPKQEQAGILRQYLAELIFNDPSLLKKAMISSKGDIRITREASRKRMTFKTGAEYRVFSGEGDANRLMGFGADIVVRDEACLINRDAYVKSGRMLGDNPDEGMQIELYNPWNRDNQAFEHTLDPEWEVIKIGWRQAVKEGRTTERFVMEQAQEYGGMSTLEFVVLYESSFPMESEDSIFNLNDINAAEEVNFTFEEELEKVENILNEEHKYSKEEIEEAKKEIKKFKKIISCDPADKGKDESIIYWGISKGNKYKLIGEYDEKKSEQMELVGKIFDKIKRFIGHRVKGEVNLDRIGIGAGALSRLKELIREYNYRNITIRGCHFGEKAMKDDHFMNKKAENYFRLQKVLNERMIDIPKFRKLKTQLIAMKWELTSSSKKKIIDPEDYSPDWADTLVYFTWKDSQEVSWFSG